MKAKIKHILIMVLGWILVLFGILGLFLPFLQGLLLLFVGLYLLSHESLWAQRMLKNIKERYPGLSKKLAKARTKLKNKKIG